MASHFLELVEFRFTRFCVQFWRTTSAFVNLNYLQCFIHSNPQGAPRIKDGSYKLVGTKSFHRPRTDLAQKPTLQALSDKNRDRLLVAVKLRLQVSNAEQQWAQPIGNHLFIVGKKMFLPEDFPSEDPLGAILSEKETLFHSLQYSMAFGFLVPTHRAKCLDCNKKYLGLKEPELDALNDLVREMEWGKELERTREITKDALDMFGFKGYQGQVSREKAEKLRQDTQNLLTQHRQKLGEAKFDELQKMARHICGP